LIEIIWSFWASGTISAMACPMASASGLVFHNGIDFGDMEQGIPEDPGHVANDFDDKSPGMARRRRNIVVDRSKTEKPGLVHGRDGGDRHIDFHKIPKQAGNLMEFVGHGMIQAAFH
jgi:hypothetical protein